MISKHISSLLVCCVAVASVGCGGSDNPPTFPVTGSVMYKGSPVSGANVILKASSASGQGATAVTDADGKFSVGTFESGDGALPGDYVVTVNKFDTPAEAPESGDADIYISDDENEEMGDEYGGAGDVAESKNDLPSKYASASTSGLTHTVTEEPTVLDIVLE